MAVHLTFSKDDLPGPGGQALLQMGLQSGPGGKWSLLSVRSELCGFTGLCGGSSCGLVLPIDNVQRLAVTLCAEGQTPLTLLIFPYILLLLLFQLKSFKKCSYWG